MWFKDKQGRPHSMKRRDVMNWAMSSKLRGQLTKGPELAAAFKEQGGGGVCDSEWVRSREKVQGKGKG